MSYNPIKKWVYLSEKEGDIIEILLENRNISNKEKNIFLNPKFEDLLDPFLIKDMDKAIDLILKFKKNEKTIGIFADYDADGIPGAALLKRVLDIIGVKNIVYIPSREEGYGLNEKGIKFLFDNGARLLISIDLGITGKKEVEFAKKLGMEVIITDHHEILEKMIPDDANCILHTHLSKKYENKNLAGGAVAYKIAQALNLKIGKPTISELKWLLDLPAISSICDMVYLTGENRTIVKYGLLVLRKSKNLGLNKLYDKASLEKSKIDTYAVGYVIGPHINAPGRVAHPILSYNLLATHDEADAGELANKLGTINRQRQDDLEKYCNEVYAEIDQKQMYKHNMIIIKKNGWNSGIIGLVSSRITEKYNRPSIVLTKEKDVWKGSARSIEGFDLVKTLEKFSKYLVSFGGHQAAAGLAVSIDKIKEFSNKIISFSNKEIDSKLLCKKIYIDAKLKKSDLNISLARKIKLFEPFGLGNTRPIFAVENVIIKNIKKIGKNLSHVRLEFSFGDSTVNYRCVGFNIGKDFQFKRDQRVDLALNVDENIWNGKNYLDLKIIDIKEAK